MIRKLLLLIFSACASLAFTSFPDEYPLYLRAIGFQKGEIRHLRDGGIVAHGLKVALPGEFGVVAARVVNVPPYYFRDYYRAIENFKTLRNFQNIGKFKQIPTESDLRPLEFTNDEFLALENCKSTACEMNLSAPEIASLSSTPNRELLADRYRQILYQRLLAYRKSGLHDAVSETQVKRFPELSEYFQPSQQFVLQYPAITDHQMSELFYWTKESPGRPTAIALHHLMIRQIGDDVLLMDREIYNSIPSLMASMAVFHLISYADRGAPATLVVVQDRIQTDLKSLPFQVFLKNYYHINLRNHVRAQLKYGCNTMEDGYHERAVATFPFQVKSRDKRGSIHQ